jgi:hypothetical protein
MLGNAGAGQVGIRCRAAGHRVTGIFRNFLEFFFEIFQNSRVFFSHLQGEGNCSFFIGDHWVGPVPGGRYFKTGKRITFRFFLLKKYPERE